MFPLGNFDENNVPTAIIYYANVDQNLMHLCFFTAQHAGEGGNTHPPPPKQTEEQLVGIIDNVLNDDDLNGDGYVSFFEFMADRGASAPAPAPEG